MLVGVMLITTGDIVRGLVFLVIAGSIFIAAGLWAAAWVVRKLRRESEPKRSTTGASQWSCPAR